LCAESIEEQRPVLVAVARLVADPDHQQADYGVHVADAFQGRGLGLLLTRKCIDIGRRWGLKTIKGETTTDNLAMIKIFRTLGFELQFRPSENAVLAKLSL
jgi:acetyltransferase